MSPEELRQLYESGQMSYEEYQRELSNLSRSAPSGTIAGTPQMRGRIPGSSSTPFNPYSGAGVNPPTSGPASEFNNIDERGRLIPQDDGYRPTLGQRANSMFNRARFGEDQPSQPSIEDFQGREDYIERMQEAQAGQDNQKTYEELAAEYDAMADSPQDVARESSGFRGPRYLNPWGGDLNTNAYLLGRALGSEKGSRGRGLGIVAGAGNLGLGLARTIGSGIGYAKRYDETMDTYRRGRTMDRNYTDEYSYYDRNYSGGQMAKYGGEKDATPQERYQRIMNSRSYMKMGGKKKKYQEGGGPGDPPKVDSSDPYLQVGISKDDPLYGKFIRVRGEGYVKPDGTTLEEPEVVDVQRLKGLKDNLRSLFTKRDRTPLDQRVTYVFEDGGQIGDVDLMRSELDVLTQLKNIDKPNFTEEDDNRLQQIENNLKQIMQEGGEVKGKKPQETEGGEIPPEIVEIAKEMSTEFQSIEQVQAYLEQEGVRPEMIEKVIKAFLMIQQQSQETEPKKKGSSVFRNTMSGDMSMEFRYGGRKRYPKL